MNKFFTLFVSKVLLIGLLLLGYYPLIGQPCVIDQAVVDSYSDISANAATGQSFTACATGVVTSLEVSFLGLQTKNLKLQMSSGTNTLNPEYTQNFTAKAPGKVLIQLTTPFPVEEYEEYAFSIVGISDTNIVAFINAYTANPYAEGNLITEIDGAVTHYEADLAFNLTIVENACVIDQANSNAFSPISTSSAIGQNFTACNSGAITMLRVNFLGLFTKALTLQMNSGTNTLSPEYKQDFQPDSSGDMVLVLSTPFVVEAGQTYAFSVIGLSPGGASLARIDGDPYASGNAFEESGATYIPLTSDLDFSITLVEDVCVIDQAETNEFVDVSTDVAVGQAFTACELGFITHIKTSFSNLGADPLVLQMSAGNNTLTPTYTQVFTPDSIGDYLIQLTTPFRIEKGMPYAFSVVGFSGAGVVARLKSNSVSTYTDGFSFIENGGVSTPTGSDIDFSLLNLLCTPSVAGFSFASNDLTTDFSNTATAADSVKYDFGDGSTSDEPNPSHTFANYGTYTVRQVSYSRCINDTLFQDVTLDCTGATAGFMATTPNDLSLAFIDNSSDADSVRYNFGDGTTSTDPNPSHTYGAGGSYTVTQIAYNTCRNDTATEQVTVSCPPPIAEFETTVSNSQVTFKNFSSNADSIFYDFGDGNTSFDPNPVHEYASSNVYQVVQIAFNNCGSDTSSTSLVVYPNDPFGPLDSVGIKQLDFPEVFTPNGDGVNDVWVIKKINLFPDNDLIILNRWGNQVYFSKSYQNNWEGTTSAGEPLERGTYFYVLRIRTPKRKQITIRETVTIVR